MSLARLSAAALVLAVALPAGAQARVASAAGAAAAAAPVAAPAAASRAITIPEGTEFAVVTTETLSSKTASEGDKVSLKVDENVVVAGTVVIPRGTAVRGVVSDVEHAGRMGKGGKLNLRVESTLATDGQRIPLRATKARSGDDKTGSTVALTVLFGPIGLLKKGKEATYPEGTRITVYTDAAISVAPPVAAAGGQ